MVILVGLFFTKLGFSRITYHSFFTRGQGHNKKEVKVTVKVKTKSFYETKNLFRQLCTKELILFGKLFGYILTFD